MKYNYKIILMQLLICTIQNMYKEKTSSRIYLEPYNAKYVIKEFFLENLGFKIYLKCKEIYTLYII